ncbi:MAG: sulfurtransferase TusA family protein [Nitrospirae bacterium]|nr:sulfurtransferase TusA family protein [Nitrospirota bacterium]
MKADETIDAIGLLCPVPILKTKMKLQEMETGQVLEVLADDEGFANDLPAWCKKTGNEFLGIEKAENYFKGYVRRTR